MAESSEPKVETNKRSRKWPWVLASLLTLLLIFLTALPELLRLAAMHWGPKQAQIQSLTIDDIDLNLFSGEVAIKGINLSGNGSERLQLKELYLNVAMTALAEQRIELQALRLDGVAIDIHQDEQQSTSVAGIALSQGGEETPEEPPSESPWGVGLESLSIRNVAFKLQTPELVSTITLRQLNLGAANSWTPSQASDMGINILIDETPLDITGRITPFAQAPDIKLDIALNALPLSLFEKIAASQGIEKLAGTLSAKLAISAAVPGRVEINSELQLQNLALRQGAHDIKLAQLQWQGVIEQLAAPESEQDLGVRVHNGLLSLQDIDVSDHQQKAVLLQLANAKFEAINLKAEQQASIERVTLTHLKLLDQPSQPLVSIGGINLEQLNYDGLSGVAMEQIAIKELVADLTLKADGQLAGLEALASPASEQATAPASEPQNEQQAASPTEPVWRVKLNRFTVGEGSRVTFVDQSVDPTYRAELTELSIALSDIDTGAPEQDLGFTFSTQINKLASLNAEATLRPFGDKVNLEASGELKHLDMPPLSPYAVKAMGYFIKRGQADATFTATIKEDMLDSKIKLKLNKFNIEEGDPDKVESMNKTLSMPLDLALDILRDKKDNIELELEIQGDINDPQFDSGKVINKAIGNATKFAAMFVLKQSLQPWSTVFSVFSFLGEKMTTPRFEPVVYTAGGSELTSDHREYLKKMGAMLDEHPEIELNICALASEQDRQALTDPDKAPSKKSVKEGETIEPQVANEELLNLAQTRMSEIKQILIDQGIDQGRLFTCHPTMEGVDKAEPSVELYL